MCVPSAVVRRHRSAPIQINAAPDIYSTMNACRTALLLVGALLAFAPRASAQMSEMPDEAPAVSYARADSIAHAAPAAVAGNVPALAAYLTRDLPTEAEKARAIYHWITENVAYDAGAYYGFRLAVPEQGATSVLRRRKAVCDGFSNLFLALGQAAGLQVSLVPGQAKGLSKDPSRPFSIEGHTWNAVKANGRWNLVDASWGAGDIVDRRFVRKVRDYYFFTPPDKFLFSHMADSPDWQLVDHPITGDEFARQVFPPTDFWEMGWRVADVKAAASRRGFPGLVGSFVVPGRSVEVMQAPVEAKLPANVAHAFRIRAPGALEVVAASGTDWHPLTAHGDVWSGEAPLTGTGMVVFVRYPETPAGAVVLQYGRLDDARSDTRHGAR